MKQFICLLLLCGWISVGYAQQIDLCDKFPSLMQKAKDLWKKKKFEDAFAKLAAAREACPSKAAEVDDQYALFIRDIAGKYETADRETRRALVATKAAIESALRAEQKEREATVSAETAARERDIAREAEKRADSIADIAEQTARQALANDLVSKSALALRDGDRTTAFRLAEMAYRFVDKSNLNVTRSLVQALYCNDAPGVQEQLPWAYYLHGHLGGIEAVAFSPDGRYIATGSKDNTTKVWDFVSGDSIATLHNASYIWAESMVFTPDGKYLVVGLSDGIIQVWDFNNDKIVQTLSQHTGPVRCMAISSDGKWLATGSSDQSVIIWNMKSYAVVHKLKEHNESVFGVSFSPDGLKLASGARDGFLMIWDVPSGKLLKKILAHSEFIYDVCFSPDGKIIATGSRDQTVKLWDMNTYTELRTFSGHTSSVCGLAFSPDGRYLASGSLDKTAKIWDMQTFKLYRTLEDYTEGIVRLVYSPDGRYLLTSAFSGKPKIWDLKSGSFATVLKGHNKIVWGVTFSPDGKKLLSVSGDRSCLTWDLSTDTIIARSNEIHYRDVRSVAYAPDGKSYATGSWDRSVKIWDAQSGLLLRGMRSFPKAVLCVTYSPNGRYLAITSSDSTAIVWNLESPTIDTFHLKGHSSGVMAAAFSPNNKLLATASWDKTIKVWDVETRKLKYDLKGHLDTVLCVAFSPDGKTLASGSMDKNIIIWDVNSQVTDSKPKPSKDASGSQPNKKSENLLYTLYGDTGYVWSLSYSPDGKMLASASSDYTIKVWDLESFNAMLDKGNQDSPFQSSKISFNGRSYFTLQGHTGDIVFLQFSPDGKRLASASSDSTVRIWEFTPDFNKFSGKHHQTLANLTTNQLEELNMSNILDVYPENEKLLIQDGNPWQIKSFADLYDNNTRSGNDLRLTASDYHHAATLYQAALDLGADTLIKFQLAELYERWARDILDSHRPDTAAVYIEKVKSTSENPGLYLDLMLLYTEKTGIKPDWDAMIAREPVSQLRAMADHLYFNEMWAESKKLYEAAEKKEHLPYVLERLYTISETLGVDPIDFNKFIGSNDTLELNEYALFFTGEANDIELYKDKVPHSLKVVMLREKQMRLENSIELRKTAANDYNSLAFYQIFALDGVGAEKSLARAEQLDPENIYIPTNRPPALFLQGGEKQNEAKRLYQYWAPKTYNDPTNANLTTYRDAFKSDLDEMEKQGVKGIDIGLIRSWLDEK